VKSDLLTVSLNKVQINANYARRSTTSAVDKLSEIDLISKKEKHPSVGRCLFRQIAFTFLLQLFELNTCNFQYKIIVMLKTIHILS
jgi:hypothetical protein